jgi:hypothetical protein
MMPIEEEKRIDCWCATTFFCELLLKASISIREGKRFCFKSVSVVGVIIIIFQRVGGRRGEKFIFQVRELMGRHSNKLMIILSNNFYRISD